MIPSLLNLTLKKQSIDVLHGWYQQRYVTEIEREFQRRLSSPDYQKVIDFLYDNIDNPTTINLLQSIYVYEGLVQSQRQVPWKIQVIYRFDDKSYRINNVGVILGSQRLIQTRNNKKFKTNVTYASQNKLVMREVVSANTDPLNNMTLVANPELDTLIRDQLHGHIQVEIGVCNMMGTYSNISYPGYQTLNEQKVMVPCSIRTSQISQPLIAVTPGTAITPYTVPVLRSDDVLKIYQLIRKAQSLI